METKPKTPHPLPEVVSALVRRDEPLPEGLTKAMLGNLVSRETCDPAVRLCMECKAPGASQVVEGVDGPTGEFACVYCMHRWQGVEPGENFTGSFSDLDARIAESRGRR